jgi:hypothetical protein
MLTSLRHERLDHSYEQERRRLIAVDLLIIDDFGLDALDPTESRDTYEILNERHRAGSIRRQRRNGIRPQTLGGDKACDTADFVADGRAEGITPHVAPNITTRRDSNLDWRTLRHAGYQLSQRCRQTIEEIFGWRKTIGGLRKTRYRGVQRTGFWAYLVGAAHDLLRMAKLMPELAAA